MGTLSICKNIHTNAEFVFIQNQFKGAIEWTTVFTLA